jgi:hypothetical protein
MRLRQIIHFRAFSRVTNALNGSEIWKIDIFAEGESKMRHWANFKAFVQSVRNQTEPK